MFSNLSASNFGGLKFSTVDVVDVVLMLVIIIDAPAKCEIDSVVRLLQAEVHSAAEIHRRCA